MKPVIAVCLILFASCFAAARAPFTNSSLDFHNGAPHTATIRAPLALVSDVVTDVMQSRGAQLARRRDTSRGSLILSFKRSAERNTGRSVTSRAHASKAPFNMGVYVNESAEVREEFTTYGSLFYVELLRDQDRTFISFLGLPVFEGVTACPPLARDRYRKCSPATLENGHSFVEYAEDQASVRVDGTVETEFIDGVLAELASLKRRKQLGNGGTESPDDAFH